MAFGIDDAVANATKLIDDIINKIWPNPADKARAEATVIQATATAALEQLRQQMSVMLAEAQSPDRWTSRARPSFMYVMYLMILAAIPMGALWAVEPAAAERVATGMQKWLAAIPDGLWATFGIGYTGYAVTRTYEKAKGVSK